MSKKIVVEWEGPINYQEAITEYNLDNEQRSDYGLYQIYGPHPLYSNKNHPGIDNVLLYIGQTTSGSKFSGRISIHGFCHYSGYEIYLGRIDPESKLDEDKWRLDVLDAEKLLINKYTPAYNGQCVGDLRIDQLNSQDCIIINLGNKMDLDDEVKSEEVVYTITG